MKRITYLIVGMLLLMSGPLWAASIDWTLGQSPVSGWSVSPVNPTSGDVISFTGPTPVQSYSNRWVGENNVGGVPQITVNSFTKTIEVWFDGTYHNMVPLILMPVDGWAGTFGPLTPGIWTFKSNDSDITFSMQFTVSGGGGGGNVIYVDADAPLTIYTPNGSSWFRAFPNLQDGLDAALPGDEVRVANGVYTPDQGSSVSVGDRGASFVMSSQVTVQGGYAGWGAPNPDERDVDLHQTILSGDLEGNDLWGILFTDDNSHHVVSAYGLAWDATLDGFTITAGRADGYGNDRYGAGLYMEAGTPVAVGALNVKHCTIHGNTASFGGGVACNGGIINFGNTLITGNYAFALGGAIYSDMGFIDVVNGLITGNLAGLAETFGGDAIYTLESSLNITSSTIADNAPGQGAPANGQAIVSVTWGPGAIHTIGVTNSILRNGGNEIFATDPGIVSVQFSNVQGGHPGFGNINADPLFTDPGLFSVEGEWYNGDYSLQGGSPSIDTGNKNQLPGDFLDLDENGNTAEDLPIDLRGYARVLNGQVDHGAYEGFGLIPPVVLVPNVTGMTQANAQSAITSASLTVGTVTEAYHSTVPNGHVISQNPAGGSVANVGAAVSLVISKGPGTGPGPGWVEASSMNVLYDVPLSPSPFPITVQANGITRTVITSFVADALLVVTPVSAGGGDWSQSQFNPDPNPIPMGTSSVTFDIKGTGFMPSALTPGQQNVVVAIAKIYVRPAP